VVLSFDAAGSLTKAIKSKKQQQEKKDKVTVANVAKRLPTTAVKPPAIVKSAVKPAATKSVGG
jgi:hypothetical protein